MLPTYAQYPDQFPWPAGDNGFRRGPYGEILPPPLVTELTPEELADLLPELINDDDVAGTIGCELLPFYARTALDYTHQQQLLRLFAGNIVTPEVAGLYRAVMRGEPVSLRPLGQEGSCYRTFAPVLRRIGDEEWRMGLPGHGRWLDLSGPAPVVLCRARQLYGMWAEAEASLPMSNH